MGNKLARQQVNNQDRAEVGFSLLWKQHQLGVVPHAWNSNMSLS